MPLKKSFSISFIYQVVSCLLESSQQAASIQFVFKFPLKMYVYEEAAKAARLVCHSLLSLTRSFFALLGPSGLIFSDLTGP